MIFRFFQALSFNGNIANWDVGNVRDMGSMFSVATNFNIDISNWDVSNVVSMYGMFYEASAFNQDLSGWCVTGFEQSPIDFDTNAMSWTESRPR